jgi:formate dehydrogenase major subunit
MVVVINERECRAREGQTVLEVARENGIFIPSVCYHRKTGPAGRCRLCVAEVEGMAGLQTTCTLKVRDGLRVTTESETVREAQRLVVDLLLASGKHDCLSCEQNGMCELQDAAYYLGIERPSFRIAEDRFEVDDSSEFIHRDESRCIQCGRCIAGCNTTVVNEVLDFGYRGRGVKVVCDSDVPMGSSSCVQCGECIQLCPVGAIIDKRSRGQGRTWELDSVETLCPYCGVGCRIRLHVDRRRNRIVRVTGVERAATNDGMLCVKGRFGHDFVSSAERLTAPLARNGAGELEPVSWDTALSLVAARLGDIKARLGPDAIGGLASAKCTNEENFVFQKFMRKEVGTNNVDHCARL